MMGIPSLVVSEVVCTVKVPGTFIHTCSVSHPGHRSHDTLRVMRFAQRFLPGGVEFPWCNPKYVA